MRTLAFPVLFLLYLQGTSAFQQIGGHMRFAPPSLAEKHCHAIQSSCTSLSTASCAGRNSRNKLYSSADAAEETDNPFNDKNNWQKNTVVVMRKIMSRFNTAWSIVCAVIARQRKQAKTMVASQLLFWTLLLGAGAKHALVQTGFAGPPSSHKAPIEVPYSRFMDLCEAKNKNIGGVVIGSDSIGYRFLNSEKSGGTAAGDTPQRTEYTRKVNASPELISYLRENKIPFQAASSKGMSTAAMALPSLILSFYVLVMIRTMKGGGGSPGKLARKSQLPMATFDEVEGIDDAKFEVMELVDSLRNPGKYAVFGARAPTGLLLEGPPGTGKTMLARATAATAGVPLLYCSGSDFVEMFVGRGAARVRKTFARAAKLAPCIIFIDELDTLGKSRDSGMSSKSNDEAEQTLNQLLACMDGLDSSAGVCVLAATNRRDVLDSALVRPGRFDRIIKVELPNAEGREQILRVHANKLPGFTEGSGIDEKRQGSLGKGRAIDLSAVAAVTSGLSGAELAFIVNEAAIRAVRRVSAHLGEGKDPACSTVQSVCAQDFEASVSSFYESRGPNGGGAMGELISNLLGK